MVSLAATFGRGAMTNGWTDVANADVVLVMGGNPAENHPVGFRFVMEAKRKRKAKLVVVASSGIRKRCARSSTTSSTTPSSTRRSRAGSGSG